MKIFDKTKSLLLDEIAKGRPKETLPDQERILYDKVLGVSLNRYRPDHFKENSCAYEALNAYYHDPSSSITLCPSYYSAPDAALVRVMAHEIAHSIDVCNSHSVGIRLLKAPQDKQKVLELAKKARLNIENVANAFVSLEQIEVGDTVYSRVTSPTDGAEIEFWKTLGIIEVANTGLPKAMTPAPVATKCLAAKMKLRPPSAKEAIRYANETFIAKSSVLSVDKAKLNKELDEAVQMAKMNPLCASDPNRPSHYGEASADMWSAKVLGRYWEEHKPSTQAEVLSGFAFEAVTLCQDSSVSGPLGEHPSMISRTNQILLADKRVQSALGCKGDPNNYCLNSVGTLPRKNASGRSKNSSEVMK